MVTNAMPPPDAGNNLQISDAVALLDATEGIGIDDKDIQLPRGQVGRIVEAKNPQVVVVEFLTLTGNVFARASVRSEILLKLQKSMIAMEPLR